jgi:DNA-nicking Smr family endonuclease
MFSRIKFFYCQLEEDYNLTREFLLKEFKDMYEAKNELRITQNKNHSKKNNKLVFNDFEWISPFGSEVNQLKNMSNNELTLYYAKIRERIKEYKKIYCLYSKCLSSSKRSNNHADAANFMSLKKKAEKTINELSHQSIYIVFKKAQEEKFQKVDLHFLFLEEAEEVLYMIFECLQYQLHHGNVGGFFDIIIVTGKGKHSKGMPVLFPKIKEMMIREKHKILSAKDGRIIISIKV